MKINKRLWIVAAVVVAVAALVILLIPRTGANQRAFLEKAERFKAQIVTDDTIEALGDAPAGSAGHVVILSICDGASRADVCSGAGKTLSEAWDKAVRQTVKRMDKSEDVRWFRADVVSRSWPTTAEAISEELDKCSTGFDFNGLALDAKFEMALPEGILNGMDIYDYKKHSISMKHLNQWLEQRGRKPLEALPEQMTGFECRGWLCDENDEIHVFYRDGADASRRQVSEIDADYALNMVDTASAYLMEQVREDGTFNYSILPQFDKDSSDYNMLRHSGTIWSLICRYRLFPGPALREKIERAIDYLLTQVHYDKEGAAYLYEAKSYEYKLGGNGITIVTLTEDAQWWDGSDQAGTLTGTSNNQLMPDKGRL
ncbi:MAG: hypothetical protein ACSW8J_00280, partial [bacterium]